MIGFIGAGNIATALMQGMLLGGVAPGEMVALDVSPARRQAVSALGVEAVDSIASLAERANILLLAVKPKDVSAALAALCAHPGKMLVSTAVGWTQEMLKRDYPDAGGIARCMPNTPAQVGESVVALNTNHSMPEEAFQALLGYFSACGKTVMVQEHLFEAVTSISGSGPAYAYLFIESMADAGVRQGLSRDMAYTLVAQTLLGAAKMVLETGKHPGELKDAVCSPAGTTIEAMYALERSGFRAAVMQAVDACAEKAAQYTAKVRESE